MKKTLNFDKFIEEKNLEPMEITVRGRVYEVAPKIPAIVPIMMARAEEELSTADTNRLVLRAADALFGKKAIDQMCADGLAVDEVGTLVQKVFSMINGDDDGDNDEQELTDEDSKVSVSRKAKK